MIFNLKLEKDGLQNTEKHLLFIHLARIREISWAQVLSIGKVVIEYIIQSQIL